MEVTERYPHFVVTCDHRRGYAPMLVARYAWDDTQGVWVHSERSRVRVEYLDGNTRDWWHRDEHGDLAPSVRPRVHYEMFCGAAVTPRCPVRPFRTDADELQNLFATLLVAGSRKVLFDNGFPGTVTGRKITITLAGLQIARARLNEVFRHQS